MALADPIPCITALRVGDTCTKQEDCSLVSHSQCDIAKGVCVCTPEYPVDGGPLCGQGKTLLHVFVKLLL